MKIIRGTRARVRRGVAGPLLAALVVGGALSAAVGPAQAATRKPIRFDRTVTVNRGVLSNANTVTVKGTVSNPVARVSSWWTKRTVAKVVRFGVNGRYERPYQSQGYRCVPTVRRRTAHYVCKLRGADVPTSVRLAFTVTYSGRSLGSGAPAANHSVTFTVTNLPAGGSNVVQLADAVLNPFPPDFVTPTRVSYGATGPSSLKLDLEGPSISASSSAPLNSAKLTVEVTTSTSDATALTGVALVPAGATLTINVDGHGAHAVSNGSFTVPLS